MTDGRTLLYSCILLAGVFISAVSQVMLKKAALKTYPSRLKEYLNPLVITAYILFFGTTFLSIFAYRVIPLSMGPVLEATSYIYVTIFGLTIFGEKLNLKKIFALVLIIGGIVVYSLFGSAGPKEVNDLKFRENGEFRILVLADCQDYEKPNGRMMAFIGAMLDKNDPDLVVFLGDNVIETNVEKFRGGARALLAPLVERGTPYAYVFGNHDDEFGVTKEQMHGIYSSVGDCRTVDAAPEISGLGSCAIPVRSSDGDRTAFILWMIDSGSYDPVNGGYDHVHADQLEWMKATAAEYNAGGIVPSMVFQHIIPPEGFDLLRESTLPEGTDGTKAYGGKNYALRLNEKAEGYLGEFPCPPTVNSGEMDVLRGLGGVIGVAVGHDHANAFIGSVGGVDIIQCPGASFASYGDDMIRGCRLITLSEASPESYETKIFTVAAYEAGAYDAER